MITIDFYRGRPVGVLGLGRTGGSTIEALVAGGADVIAWDDSKKARRADALTQSFRLRPPDHDDWCGVDVLVPSPGISERHDLIERARLLKIKITGDVELFGRAMIALKPHLRPKLVAITGTNGKSTVTKLVAHILQMAGLDVEMGGNVGVPVLSLAPFEKNRIYVLEVSSYQAGHLQKFAPSVAVQLNITPDHTERHGSLENYAAAKAKIFSRLSKRGIAIIGINDRFGRKLASSLKSQTNVVRLPDDIADAPSCENKHLVGDHHRQNIMAAWAVARVFNIGADLFQVALESWTGLAHRMEEIARVGAVRFIDDSKATNAAAACQALAACGDVYWLAGGAAKAEGFEALRGALSSVRHAYLFGAARDELGDFLGDQISWTKHQTLREAVHQAGRDAQEHGQGVVLLSPACASFDEFTDFAARGDAFGVYVREQSGRGAALMAAGGTGGGLFPAEGLAQELRRRGFQCVLLTDRRALPLVDRALWDGVHRIFSSPIAGRSPLAWLSAVFWMGLGILQSLWILTSRGSKRVIGFGGYPSLPPLLAAILLRRPILIHEPGASLGRANRWLMRFARAVATSFPLKESFAVKPPPSTLTGNPVRSDIVHLSGWPYESPRKNEPFRLTIFAGSQGAQVFDEIVPQALALVASTGRSVRITQQFRGEGESRDKVMALYQRSNIAADLAPFFTDLPRHIVRAHLVIARAGASTMSELAILGRPAIVIPLTGAAAHEQMANARSFEAVGAIWVIAEEDLKPETLARRIEALIDDPEALTRAAKAARHHAQMIGSVDASARLADFVEAFVVEGSNRGDRS